MKTENQTMRGEMASREKAKNQSKKYFVALLGKVIQIKYEDHIQFERSDISKMKPSIRKAVCWLITDTTDFIRVCYDQPIEPLPGEKLDSGFVILKSCILEVLELTPHTNDLNKTTYQIMGNFSPIIEENEKCKS
jgi:hypothetical protein